MSVHFCIVVTCKRNSVEVLNTPVSEGLLVGALLGWGTGRGRVWPGGVQAERWSRSRSMVGCRAPFLRSQTIRIHQPARKVREDPRAGDGGRGEDAVMESGDVKVHRGDAAGAGGWRGRPALGEDGRRSLCRGRSLGKRNGVGSRADQPARVRSVQRAGVDAGTRERVSVLGGEGRDPRLTLAGTDSCPLRSRTLQERGHPCQRPSLPEAVPAVPQSLFPSVCDSSSLTVVPG